ncbi:uncharacterized protein C16orf90 homolog isoform X3 [Octodon degus]|uniref:Uncharacterized protein C16orf90 homolog isoform X3 n=1 Tax=Octodon degus TaxID=10160 RepID=A0A6P6E4M0_OCTDE|nr:uncharacterized protein C16orf90 homolog isoform X3 [Octodon degus]
MNTRLAGCYLPTFPPADAVSWAGGHPSHPNIPPNIYEGGLGTQQEQCLGVQGSKPKNFRLRHLRSLALYLPGHMQPTGQAESPLQSQLLVGDCLPQPEDTAWSLDLPYGTLGPASSSSMNPAKGSASQPESHEGLGFRPKRSWRTLEEAMCPLCKRTRSGALERS